MSLPQRILDEFGKSKVSDRLTRINVSHTEGEEAIDILTEYAIAKAQKVESYLTERGKKIRKGYEFARTGGWVAYGTNPEGTASGEVAYFKGFTPRKNFEWKTIKYETPSDAEALPIQPWVDDESAQAIYQSFGVTPSKGETFWQVVWRCNLPIVITEGLKKALAIIAHGMPAIAVRGIGCWHRKGTRELHQAISHFATPRRTFYIVFDQDEKLVTQRDVRNQTLKLGSELEAIGCKVFVPVWETALGKGIDDVLYAKQDEAQSCFDDLIENAPSLNDYRRYGRTSAALSTIDRLNRLSYPIERETEGEYLTELPGLQQGEIHVTDASINSGKSVRIGRDWVQEAKEKGWHTVVLSPLNSLGQQTAQNWGLPHIHSFGTTADQQQALWSLAKYEGGVVLCPDSLHRIPDWFLERPVLLVLDEANQVIEHTCEGNTLGSRQSEILERFSDIAKHANATGAIILSEDGIPDRAINFIKTISGAETVRVIKHRKKSTPWNCTVFSGQASGYRAQLLQTIQRGERILIVTSSQREGKRLEKAIAKLAPDAKVVRIDSETNQQGDFNAFFESPDSWLGEIEPDVLILSPSAKSGVSIQGGVPVENAYFSGVWGYFPALATDTHMQLLGRYRPPVPRFVFVPAFILSSGDESLLNPRAIKRRLGLNVKLMAGVYALSEMLESEGDRAENMVRIETAVLDYLAESRAVAGAQKSIAHDALVRRLENAGHFVKTPDLEEEKNKRIQELWDEIDEELWREDAEAIASATIDDQEHTLDWARKVLGSLDATLETRTIAHKVLWREEFPGVSFDDSEESYQALCQDYGAMRRGVLTQARVENLEAAKEEDRDAAEAVFKDKIRAWHRLPKNYVRAALLDKTGILNLLDGTYTNSDPRAIAVKKEALYWKSEINYWLRLQINEDQTPVEIVNKLLRKLGLEAIKIARPGKRGERRDTIWEIAGITPVRLRLLEAARRKLSSTVSSTRNRGTAPPIQIDDTSPKQPPPSPEIEDVRRMWEQADTPEAISAVQQVAIELGYPPDPAFFGAVA
jgi:hypothetical protein